jgi:N-carbamoylputrescine amidase
MRQVTLATTQTACGPDVDANLDRAEALVREAAAGGAQIVLLQELFASEYFCKDESSRFFGLAQPFEGSPLVARFASLARELGLVLPVSFFERSAQVHFNSLTVVDADGRVLGLYRKSHIPESPGYQEKFYFSPGDTGFKVWDTAFGRIGVGICWDQWFPECARAMALQGAEILMYPTAIGSEPSEPDLVTTGHWQRTMQGHSAANAMPVVASNRIGREVGDTCEVTFYGHSFVTDGTGSILAEADAATPGCTLATVDLDAMADARDAFGLFRDRRPDLYGPLLTLDGRSGRIGD